MADRTCGKPVPTVAHLAFLLSDDGSVPLFKEMQQQLATVAAVGRPPPARIFQGSGYLFGLCDHVARTGSRHTQSVTPRGWCYTDCSITDPCGTARGLR